jgi:predicted TIM-barrel fold metal-dependent hydrolase
VYPHWFELSPDHRKYYPFYAKCEELGVPIQMQVGHCLRYSEERPLPSVGRPSALDTIACDFPGLKLIGIHTGWPWVEEMISVAYKHPNVYVATDAYTPRHWPASLVHFIATWGRDKVLFGTDFPVLTFQGALREIDELRLPPASAQRFLRDNAVELYNLHGRLATTSGSP